MKALRASPKKKGVVGARFHAGAIPAGLRQLSRWVTYDTATKAPDGDVTDPATWLSFAQALRRAHAKNRGIGFAFVASDHLCGIDLDNVRNPDSGELLPAAREIVRLVASYTEISPSGRGLHIIARARLPRNSKHKLVVGPSPLVQGATVRFEAYDRARYFTVTGNVLGKRAKVRDRQSAVKAFVAKYLATVVPTVPAASTSDIPPESAQLTDDGVMAALQETHKQDYRHFFEVGPKEGDDDSSLDYRLALRLVRMVGRDPARIERLMRRSRLVREKWDKRRGESTYLRETIDKVLRDARVLPSKGGSEKAAPAIVSPYEPTELATTAQDGTELFAELHRHLGRYVRMGEHEKVFLSLWILHTHALDAAEQTPYVHVSSPAAACGKSTLITVLQGLVNKGVRVVNASTSFLFRVLDADAPTLLVDEVHRWLHGDSKGELHALLHDGYHVGGRVGRVAEVRGEGSTKALVPTYYKTWGAKLFAGIGRDLTAELMSRCVPVRLVRASPGEQESLKKVRARPYAKVAGRLRGRCARWTKDNLAKLKRARPELPQSLDGRQ